MRYFIISPCFSTFDTIKQARSIVKALLKRSDRGAISWIYHSGPLFKKEAWINTFDRVRKINQY